MFNFNAETFVILYPYAAGGRFLQMAMSLDPSVTVMHTRLWEQPTADRLFDEYLQTLTSGHNNAHYKDSGHLPEYKPENMLWANRYVFCIHQAELAPALEFLRKCRNLKIFIVNTSTNKSFNRLACRRWYFAQRVELALQDGYKLHKLELDTIRSINDTIKFRVGAFPVGSIELEDYWDPTKAVPALNKFFATNNINAPRWEELYQVWIDNAIRPTIKDAPSNS